MAATKQRTTKKPALTRGEPVVRRVLSSTIEELARVGYAALRVEDVAALARVNKTTVYRRWLTKEDLVRAALLAMAGDGLSPPDTGSLEGDLLEIGRFMSTFGCSPLGQSVGRMLLLESPGSKLLQIVRTLRDAHESIPRSVFARAVARGELSSTKGTRLVLDALKGTLHHRLFVEREKVDERFLRELVELLLHGVLGRRPSSASAAKKRH